MMSNEATGKENKDVKQKARKNANSAMQPSAAAMAAVAMPHHRIPRPPNAFMIFANEHRKILAKKFPRESNKEISCRLGKMWRALGDDIKGKYHGQAKILDMEHKKKYPDYVYNPRDARLRKEARRQRIIAGNNLAKAMTHHIMVKQAKNNILSLNQQRLPGPIPCLKGNLEDQMKQSQKMGIREQVLRGLGLDGGDKRPLGYFIAPTGQQGGINGFQTFLAPSSIPMHLLQPRHPPPSATITNPANSFATVYSSTSTTTTTSCAQSPDNKDQLRHVVSKLVNDTADNRPREAVTVQFVNPTSQESIPKNPLLTLADEAVSKLSESNCEEKGGEGEIGGDEEQIICEKEMSDSDIKMESAEQYDGKECIEMTQQMFLDQMAMRDKNMHKSAPVITSWMRKPDVRVTRPMPLYFMQSPNQPGLISMRPPMAACIQYAANSPQVYQGSGNGNGGMQQMNESQNEGNSISVSSSPRMSLQSASSYSHSGLWDSNLDTASLLANNSIYSTSNPYSSNYGNPIVPWSGGHVVYVPMQELAYSSPFPYQSSYQNTMYQGNYKQASGGTLVKPGDDLANLTFTMNDDGSNEDGLDGSSNGKNFGQILSTTMQILTEEQSEQDVKGLDPICHVNYEIVEKEGSPNRQLTELAPATQTAVFY